MRILLIGGYPASGKSHIIRELIAQMNAAGSQFTTMQHEKLLKYMRSENTIILGTYEKGEKFPGTDKLAMNVQSEVEGFLLDKAKRDKLCVVIMEGDRVFNKKMIVFIKTFVKAELILCIVKAENGIIEERQDNREQDASWRKGRETKVNHIALENPINLYIQNNTPEDAVRAARELLRIARGGEFEKTTSKIKDLWKT